MDAKRKHLVDMLQKFETGVLVTKTNTGELHGRPMDIAQVEIDGSIYFSASLQSPKIKEIESDPTVGLFFQEAKHWVSLSGHAEVVRNQELIRKLWKESWKVWFPEGKESSDLCLLHIVPTSGEYWDISGQRGVRFVFEAMKAYLSGTRPSANAEGNSKVRM